MNLQQKAETVRHFNLPGWIDEPLSNWIWKLMEGFESSSDITSFAAKRPYGLNHANNLRTREAGGGCGRQPVMLLLTDKTEA